MREKPPQQIRYVFLEPFEEIALTNTPYRIQEITKASKSAERITRPTRVLKSCAKYLDMCIRDRHKTGYMIGIEFEIPILNMSQEKIDFSVIQKVVLADVYKRQRICNY